MPLTRTSSKTERVRTVCWRREGLALSPLPFPIISSRYTRQSTSERVQTWHCGPPTPHRLCQIHMPPPHRVARPADLVVRVAVWSGSASSFSSASAMAGRWVVWVPTGSLGRRGSSSGWVVLVVLVVLVLWPVVGAGRSVVRVAGGRPGCSAVWVPTGSLGR